MTTEDPNELWKRMDMAISSAAVGRAILMEVWPECHKVRCQHRHPDPNEAFAMISHQIREAIQLEVQYRYYSDDEDNV